MSAIDNAFIRAFTRERAAGSNRETYDAPDARATVVAALDETIETDGLNQPTVIAARVPGRAPAGQPVVSQLAAPRVSRLLRPRAGRSARNDRRARRTGNGMLRSHDRAQK